MSSIPNIAGLTNRGIFVVNAKEPYGEKSLRDEGTANIRGFIFSPKGTYLAYRTDKKAEIVKCDDWSVVATFNGNIKDMLFSPLDSYFMVWELFVMNKDNPQGKPNTHVYKSATGELVGSFVQKNQNGWEPKWSSDEKLFSIMISGRVQVYEDGNLERFKATIQCEKLTTFSISPSTAPYYFSIFTLGKSGQPSFWRVLEYPALDVARAVVSRSSFQADKAAFHWNRRGTNLFALTQTDVDKTGGSYYGKQSLSYGDVKGNAGNMTFSKEGPIHALAWNPGSWNEWVCVYGHAPAKATLFNAKCEPQFEFGTGAWNSVYFAPEGNLLLGGFGNIAAGLVEVWDARGCRRVGSCSAPDTTALQWGPRGECLLTATTSPRLTVANGYKVWHYSGALLHKRMCADKEQLLAVAWQPGAYPKSELSRTTPKGIVDSTPKPAAAAYRPPGARNKPSNFTLHEHEKPHRPGETPGATPSKAALEQKKKREARKAKKAEEKAQDGDAPPPAAPAPASAAPRPAFVSTGDPEKDKKIKNLNKKISDIEKLKQQKAAGKPLEINQLEKIKTEAGLLKELEQLRL